MYRMKQMLKNNQRGGDIGFFYGPWVGQNGNKRVPIQAVRKINGGEEVYLIDDGGTIKMVSATGKARYYAGKISDFDASKYDSYNDAQTGHYMVSLEPKNKFDFLPLEDRCKAYEKIVATGSDIEKEKYKILYGDECIALYQSDLVKCTSGTDGNVAGKEHAMTKCKEELKRCVTEFNITVTGQIESAWFGPNNGNHTNTTNVKEILIRMQKASNFQITVNTQTFGDPAPKMEKFLFINYRTAAGEFKKYKIPQNSVFDLQFPHADVRLGQTGGQRRPNSACSEYTLVKQPVNPQQQVRPLPGSIPYQSQGFASATRTTGSMPYAFKQSGGAANKAPSSIHDNSPYCSEWANRNPSECIINEAYMRTTCPKSCAEYKINNASPKHHKQKAPVVLGNDPLADMSAYGMRNHRDFAALMKNYVPIDSCPDIKDYVLKSSVIDVHQKALELISEIKSLNVPNEKNITLHPQYKETMNKYALVAGQGHVPCQQCTNT